MLMTSFDDAYVWIILLGAYTYVIIFFTGERLVIELYLTWEWPDLLTASMLLLDYLRAAVVFMVLVTGYFYWDVLMF